MCKNRVFFSKIFNFNLDFSQKKADA